MGLEIRIQIQGNLGTTWSSIAQLTELVIKYSLAVLLIPQNECRILRVLDGFKCAEWAWTDHASWSPCLDDDGLARNSRWAEYLLGNVGYNGVDKLHIGSSDTLRTRRVCAEVADAGNSCLRVAWVKLSMYRAAARSDGTSPVASWFGSKGYTFEMFYLCSR